jgi:hypothetical protein
MDAGWDIERRERIGDTIPWRAGFAASENGFDVICCIRERY